jgi:hypothetical protein
MRSGLALTSQYADIRRACEVDGLTLAETAFSAGVRMPCHEHGLAHFYLVLHGACTDSHSGTSDHCEPATLMFHPVGTRHSCDYRGHGARTLFIQTEERWLERVREHSGLPDRSVSIRRGVPVWLASRLYHELRELDSPPAAHPGGSGPPTAGRGLLRTLRPCRPAITPLAPSGARSAPRAVRGASDPR